MTDAAVTEKTDSATSPPTSDKATDKTPAATADKGKPAADAGKGAAKAADKGTGGDEDKTADKSPSDKATGSILDDEGEAGDEDTKKAAAPADWPEDWREKAVAGIADEKARAKELKRLGRMKSPPDMYKSLRALEQKFSSGEYVKRLPEDATDEEKAEWRKDVGVPEKPEDYKLPTIKGHEWSEADKPIVDQFLVHLHKADAPQAQVDAALGWYAQFQQEREEAVMNLDREDKSAREDELRAELGAEYRPSINLLGRLLKDEEAMPKGLGPALIEARTSDGHRLINHPAFAAFFIDMAKERYGEAALITGDSVSKTNTRKAEIEKILATDFDEYYKQGLDKEYADILRKEAGRGGKRAA